MESCKHNILLKKAKLRDSIT